MVLLNYVVQLLFDGNPFDHILQFTHVARPRIARQRVTDTREHSPSGINIADPRTKLRLPLRCLQQEFDSERNQVRAVGSFSASTGRSRATQF
jgi:hypothetical protein